MNNKITNSNSINNNIKAPFSFTSNSNKNLVDGLPDCLKKILKEAHNDTYEQLWKRVDSCSEILDGFNRVDNSLYKYGNYFLKITVSPEIETCEYLLPRLKEKGINIAPEYVGSVVTKEGFGLLICSVDGAKNSDMLTFNQHRRLVPQSSKKRCYQDIKKLIDLNIGNYQLMCQEKLYITPDKEHNFVCFDWNDLYNMEQSDASAKKEILDRFYSKLFCEV